MKRTTFVLATAMVAVLGFAACEREEVLPQRGSNTSENIAHEAPWYATLAGTKWYSHSDIQVGPSHVVIDRYWDFLTESTFVDKIIMSDWDEVIEMETKYAYNQDSLKCTIFPPEAPIDYYLDTVAKTLTYFVGAPYDNEVFTLVE